MAIVFVCTFYVAVVTGYYAAYHSMTRQLVEMQIEQVPPPTHTTVIPHCAEPDSGHRKTARMSRGD